MGQRVGGSVHTGKGRQQRGMCVDHPVGKRLEEARSDQLHESREYHDVRIERGHRVGKSSVPGCAIGMVNDPAGEGRHTGRVRPVEGDAGGPVRPDRGDSVRLGFGRVQQCLQQRPGTGSQHHDVLHRTIGWRRSHRVFSSVRACGWADSA